MAIYAIADLHLGFSSDKPMDIFGDHWAEHSDQLHNNWIKSIKEEDLVLIPGDISWALHFRDAATDLNWLCNLPGKKIIMRGNHDYWWSTVKKMKAAYPELLFLQNNCHEFENYAICGTRGWLIPGEQGFSEDQDLKIYSRELIRLELSLQEGTKTGKEIIALMHFPPCSIKIVESGFTRLLEQYGVKRLYYGHVHANFENIFEGTRNKVDYKLVSSDYLRFEPLRIQE